MRDSEWAAQRGFVVGVPAIVRTSWVLAPPWARLSSGIGARYARFAITVGILLGLASCAAARPTMGLRESEPSTVVLDEGSERAILEGDGGRGRLVALSDGIPGRGTTITVHGVNAAPSDLQPLHERAARNRQRLLTFVYDDRFRRLRDSSRELATAIAKDQREHGDGPLTIEAHSMGARIALSALNELMTGQAWRKNLEGRLSLHLIAPALGGIAAANIARLAPPPLARAIAGVAPGIDMGTRSAFQVGLETVDFPPSVRTDIYIGREDRAVDSEDVHFRLVAQRLHAEVIALPAVDHVSVIEAVADSRTVALLVDRSRNVR
jgi:hypothetical protein